MRDVNEDLAPLILALLLLTVGANVLGQLFARMRQPKVVGEILAGVLFGPSLLGHLAPGAAASIFGASTEDPSSVVLGFLYHFGLLLLMFISGASVRHVLGKENRRPTAWILGLGTPLPFLLVLFLAPLLPLEEFTGAAGSESAVVLVFAIAAAVTSIPVITKIFHDLGILHTRFASLILGAAVLEDIALWGVLAIATAIASATLSAEQGQIAGTVSVHVVANVGYVFVAMVAAPPVLRWASRARWNTLASQSLVAWIMAVMLGYVVVAGALDVTLVFAAFLAAFGMVGGVKGTERERFRDSLGSIEHVASAVFIPLYFALVGYRLDFTKSFDPRHARRVPGRDHACRLVLGRARVSPGRVPRTRHREPRSDVQRPRRTGHRARLRCLRCRHHQRPLLHDARREGRAHLTGVRGLAGLRRSARVAPPVRCRSSSTGPRTRTRGGAATP